MRRLRAGTWQPVVDVAAVPRSRPIVSLRVRASNSFTALVWEAAGDVYGVLR